MTEIINFAYYGEEFFFNTKLLHDARFFRNFYSLSWARDPATSSKHEILYRDYSGQLPATCLE